MAFPVPALPLSTVVSLINEWGSMPAMVSVKPWAGYPAADSAFRQEFAAAWGEDAAAVTDDTIVQSADILYPVFAMMNAPARTRVLNRLCTRTGLTPQLRDPDGGLSWQVSRDRERLLAAMLVPLLLTIAADGPSRLGICTATDCADVFVDESPTQNRAYCSTRCQTRERVRAFRERQRADAAASDDAAGNAPADSGIPGDGTAPGDGSDAA
jgi:hypothetical protein